MDMITEDKTFSKLHVFIIVHIQTLNILLQFNAMISIRVRVTFLENMNLSELFESEAVIRRFTTVPPVSPIYYREQIYNHGLSILFYDNFGYQVTTFSPVVSKFKSRGFHIFSFIYSILSDRKNMITW